MKISLSCSVCLGRDICDITGFRKYNDTACQNFHKLVEEKLTSTISQQLLCASGDTKLPGLEDAFMEGHKSAGYSRPPILIFKDWLGNFTKR